VRYLRELLAVRQDMGERILTQRLVIYQRWVKTFRSASTHTHKHTHTHTSPAAVCARAQLRVRADLRVRCAVSVCSPLAMDEAIREANKKLLFNKLLSSVNMSLEVPDRECIADGGGAEPCPEA
jgi:hypothetical protein